MSDLYCIAQLRFSRYNKDMNILIIGFGSIGQRHARLLDMQHDTIAVVSQQGYVPYPSFETIEEGVAKHTPSYVVICSVTGRHESDLEALKASGYRGKVLVEKPIYHHMPAEKPEYPFGVHVAYQLRFHTGVRDLKMHLANKTPLSAHMYVGQHLSQWRPARDVKETYSAHKDQGGGVVRDLSHELDLASYLFGKMEQCHAICARTDDITVDSEDAAAFAMRSSAGTIISLQMNYLDHQPRREIIVNTKEHSYKLDMIANTLQINDKTHDIAYQTDSAYIAMHENIITQDGANACTLKEALALTELIDTVAPL